MIGEEINAYLIKLFDLKDDAFVILFTVWSSICGVIQMTSKKAKYIKKQTGLSETDFIQAEFRRLFKML